MNPETHVNKEVLIMEKKEKEVRDKVDIFQYLDQIQRCVGQQVLECFMPRYLLYQTLIVTSLGFWEVPDDSWVGGYRYTGKVSKPSPYYEQGMVDGSASKPVLRQDNGF